MSSNINKGMSTKNGRDFGFHTKSAPKVYALFEGNIGDFALQNLPLIRIGSWEKGIIGFEEPLGLREIGPTSQT
jgi:hypothetical protein